MWNFLFPGASEAAVGHPRTGGVVIAQSEHYFFDAAIGHFHSAGNEYSRVLSRTEGWLCFEEAAACISFLHKVERIVNESFGEYFRIPRLHGGEELAGRLFRCNGCEVYAADRFGEVDPFDAVVSPKEGVGQRYVVNDALQFGDGYGCFAVGLLDFQPDKPSGRPIEAVFASGVGFVDRGSRQVVVAEIPFGRRFDGQRDRFRSDLLAVTCVPALGEVELFPQQQGVGGVAKSSIAPLPGRMMKPEFISGLHIRIRSPSLRAIRPAFSSRQRPEPGSTHIRWGTKGTSASM